MRKVWEELVSGFKTCSQCWSPFWNCLCFTTLSLQYSLVRSGNSYYEVRIFGYYRRLHPAIVGKLGSQQPSIPQSLLSFQYFSATWTAVGDSDSSSSSKLGGWCSFSEGSSLFIHQQIQMVRQHWTGAPSTTPKMGDTSNGLCKYHAS